MRTLKMAFVVGFVGALMASNVAMLQAAPLPTNVASMKSMVADNSIQVRWGGGWGYRGFGWGYRVRGYGYYPAYGYRWQAIQEPGLVSFYRPYGYRWRGCCYW